MDLFTIPVPAAVRDFQLINDCTGAVATDPQGINNQGYVVGYFKTDSDIKGFVAINRKCSHYLIALDRNGSVRHKR